MIIEEQLFLVKINVNNSYSRYNIFYKADLMKKYGLSFLRLILEC